MKICRSCNLFYQEDIMTCRRCKDDLMEISLMNAIKLTQQKSLKDRIGGKTKQELPDAYKQYHIRSYLGNRSLFLDFDLHKNRLKHGRRLKRFFIAPINMTAVFNIPWFFFNIIATNLFHMEYVDYCSYCNSKCNKKTHTQEECNYNIEYYNILNDIISGTMVDRKEIYKQYSAERQKKGLKSAYYDLFCRQVRTEIFWDLMSVGLSVAFWLFIIVYISFPMFKVLVQKLHQIESYQLGL